MQMIRTPTLDVDAVKAFVAIADLQSFTRAAKALGTTQGAMSVTLKRLEDRIGQRLIERTPRAVRLSAQGAAFLASARDFIAAHDRALEGIGSARRRFRIGIATEVGATEIPTVLARLNAHDPSLLIDARLSDAGDVVDALDRGDIDAAIVRRENDRRDGELLVSEHFGWFAAPDFVCRFGEPVRLASSSPSCHMRNLATHALNAARIPWTEVLLGCGSFAVAEAVTAGLATSVFSYRLAPSGTVDVGQRFGLPPIPASEIILLSAPSDAQSRGVLRTVASAFREHRTPG